jgi:hypothetical protein
MRSGRVITHMPPSMSFWLFCWIKNETHRLWYRAESFGKERSSQDSVEKIKPCTSREARCRAIR